jgi:hypothetical protein
MFVSLPPRRSALMNACNGVAVVSSNRLPMPITQLSHSSAATAGQKQPRSEEAVQRTSRARSARRVRGTRRRHRLHAHGRAEVRLEQLVQEPEAEEEVRRDPHRPEDDETSILRVRIQDEVGAEDCADRATRAEVRRLRVCGVPGRRRQRAFAVWPMLWREKAREICVIPRISVIAPTKATSSVALVRQLPAAQKPSPSSIRPDTS